MVAGVNRRAEQNRVVPARAQLAGCAYVVGLNPGAVFAERLGDARGDLGGVAVVAGVDDQEVAHVVLRLLGLGVSSLRLRRGRAIGRCPQDHFGKCASCRRRGTANVSSTRATRPVERAASASERQLRARVLAAFFAAWLRFAALRLRVAAAFLAAALRLAGPPRARSSSSVMSPRRSFTAPPMAFWPRLPPLLTASASLPAVFFRIPEFRSRL